MDLDAYLLEKKRILNESLNHLIPPLDAPYKVLFDAARYSLQTPGKRLRPMVTFATVDALGGDPEAAIIPACTLELVHTYSLIHDDLPCMDNDDYRRGMPTVHKAFSEPTALLAGSFLLTYAFELLAEAPLLAPEKRLALIALLSNRAGGEGMIAGQVMDMEAEGTSPSFEMLELIHLKKTGALISAAFEFGAVIAGASDEIRHFFRRYGSDVGLAFQLMDDVRDVLDGEAKHGIPGCAVSSDLANRKTTAVSHLGVEGARSLAAELIFQANTRLEQFPFQAQLLNQLTQAVLDF